MARLLACMSVCVVQMEAEVSYCSSERASSMLCVPFAWQLSLANQWASVER